MDGQRVSVCARHCAVLPQDDPDPERRKRDLEEEKTKYALRTDKDDGNLTFPVRSNGLPDEEEFSWTYNFFLLCRGIIGRVLMLWILVKMTIRGFFYTDKKFEHLRHLYHTKEPAIGSEPLETYYVPHSIRYWQSDQWFGLQRLIGVDPTHISLCRRLPDALSDCIDILEDKDRNLLEGMTVEEAIVERRLFTCDLKCMAPYQINAENRLVLPSPIALFYISGEGDLLPVAIRMFQYEVAPDCPNPVFFRPPPGDEKHKYTWLMAKMWYNLAESNYHETTTHLMLTHLVMEGFCLATHRHLHRSHPIFRLLAPHFSGLLKINSAADAELLSHGGKLNKILNIGAEDGLKLATDVLRNWRMDEEGTLPAALQARGLDEESVLKNKYFYRDDAIALYVAIQNYATRYINTYYTTDDRLRGDPEIQEWAHTLAREYQIKGVPNGGKLESRDNLLMMVTCIIFTCSVQHAAINFPQYDQYGFAPNYPGILKDNPPCNPQAELSEDRVFSTLQSIKEMLDTMEVTQFLSSREKKYALGVGLEDYIVCDEATACIETFRAELREITKKIEKRNEGVLRGEMPQQLYYDYLNPAKIPNSIKI